MPDLTYDYSEFAESPALPDVADLPVSAPVVQSQRVPRPKAPSEYRGAPVEPAVGQWLTVRQASSELDVAPQLVRRWISQGRLKARYVNPRLAMVLRRDLALFTVRSKGRPCS